MRQALYKFVPTVRALGDRARDADKIGTIINVMQHARQQDPETGLPKEAQPMSIMRDSREQDSEIDLRECVQVVIKRKKLALTVFLVPVLITAVWSFLAPKVYEISMVIEPPISSMLDAGAQGFDSVGNIKGKIQSGAFDIKIISELNINEPTLRLNVTQPKDTNLIRVSLERTADKTEVGRKTLARLLELLSLNYEKFIGDNRNRIGNQIKTILSQISTKENEIKSKREQFKILADRERQFIEEIKEAKSNSESLHTKREALFGRKENRDDISSLLYTATIQQNNGYSIQLQNELSGLKTQQENILNGIDNLKNSINESRIEIGNLNLSIGSLLNIQVIQEPLVSLRPIGPKRARNILIAAMIGLIVGMAAAFSLEFAGRPDRSR
ncbi:MAG: Wzz/FepE/Etk N-terminal domain-containing protein [Elusimicrobiota bacterium]